MQTINLLVVNSERSPNIEYFLASKYLKKLYITSKEEVTGTIQINFNTFKELAERCKALQIDLVIVEEEKFILQGIGDVLKKNFINCIAPVAPWTKLSYSNSLVHALLDRYKIATPPIISMPMDFPVIVKGDGVLKKANSLQEVIKIKEDIFNISGEVAKTVYLEKYLNGEKYDIISLYDGKHLLTFPNEQIDSSLLEEYTFKLEKMMTEEHADFVGFINSKIIPFEGVLYNTGFSFKFIMPKNKYDILYIINAALYQKLYEIEF